MANCTTCGNEREARWLLEGLCVGCSKKKSKTVINGPITPLTSNMLKQLPQAQHEILPSDSQSMIGAKRQRELLDDELGCCPQDGPEQQDDDEEIKQGEISKRQKTTEIEEQGLSRPSLKPQECENNVLEQRQDELNSPGESNKNQRIVFGTYGDYQVIDLLKELQNGDTTEQIRAQDLQEICYMFSQEVVYNFLAEMEEYDKLIDALLLVYDRSKLLIQQQLVGLVMASLALGGATWLGAVSMLNNTLNRECVLASLKPYLQKIFGRQLADWMCIYWRITEQPQLDLIRQLSHNSTSVDGEVMTLSLVTSFQDMKSFVRFSSAFVKTALPCAERIFQCIKQHIKQQKISFDELLVLTGMLQSSSYDSIIINISEKLTNTQIYQWKDLLIAESNAAKIANSSSVQVFLDELAVTYGNITQFGEDATARFRDFQILLEEAPLKPNDRQLALAQYCIGKLYGETQRQLWVVPSGQGKSRIAASAAALALMSGAVTKVHFVFDSKHLLERDKRDFEAYWMLLGYDESHVQYHFGCDFKPSEGELIIIDEADAIMFEDPVQFNEAINGCLVLGFTATPDNFNVNGAESRVASLLKFQKCYYMIGQQQDKEPNLTFDEVPKYDSPSEKADFIVKHASNGPVLVYCQEELAEALKATGSDPLLVTEDIDSDLLRNLDQTLPTGMYRVLIAKEQSAMRGYDYRSHKCQITLVIDRSFENLREAIQGYNRVGRFDDQCKRIRFSDVTLIDQQASLKYSGVLLRASLQLQKKPVQIKKIQVKKSATSITSQLPKSRVKALLQQKSPALAQASLVKFLGKE